jgi:ABC-type thiamine transport system ATPase subunit
MLLLEAARVCLARGGSTRQLAVAVVRLVLLPVQPVIILREPVVALTTGTNRHYQQYLSKIMGSTVGTVIGVKLANTKVRQTTSCSQTSPFTIADL